MAIISISAHRAERDGSPFTSVLFDGVGLGRTTAEARNVDEAEAAVKAFAAEVAKAYPPSATKGISVSAHWPRTARKPRGWDASWSKRLSIFVFA